VPNQGKPLDTAARLDDIGRTVTTSGETQAPISSVGADGVLGGELKIESMHSTIERLASAENPPATHDGSSGVELNANAKAPEQPPGALSIGHAPIGAEPTTNGNAAVLGESAVGTLAGSSVAEHLGESIAASYARTPNGESSRFELQLNPPELGRVVVRLEKSEGKVTAKLLVTNEAARVSVERELPALQQSLEEAGVSLDEFELTQRDGRHGDERAEERRRSAFYWAQEGDAGDSPATSPQVHKTTADQVDLKA